MPKTVDIQEIAAKNPRVNLEALEEGRRLRKSLYKAGLKPRRVTIPIDRRRVVVDDDIASDPRAVTLGLDR